MPQTRVEPGSRIYSFHESYTSHTVTQTVMSSPSFLTPSSAACNGSGGLNVPGGGGGGGGGGSGGFLSVGGGGGALGGEGGHGNLYAAIGRKPTPMLARKNTPDNMTQISKNSELNVTSFQTDSSGGNKASKITTTSSSSSSSTMVKLPAINTTHNSMVQGNVRPSKVDVQPVSNTKTDTSHKHDSKSKHHNNNESSKSRKKNVHFGDAHVVDDSWITDKWCKRGLSINAIRISLRKRFRRNRNTVSSDKQCSPEEPTPQEAEEKIPQKPFVQPAPILKTRGQPNPLPSGSSPELHTTLNSLHNVNANLWWTYKLY